MLIPDTKIKQRCIVKVEIKHMIMCLNFIVTNYKILKINNEIQKEKQRF